ncbi:MAG TPA: hypothetical protein DCZ92_00080 [Elusimicrobia bacterium]|nr:MAG: hypothetical protein A2016_12640 [Elusimicrobia bacterium GWF2_62_30]HBA59224.1 hypothetical protein [Elusimicrobiota bacterium]
MNHWFVFEVTTLCDKRCPLCCNDSMSKGAVMNFDVLAGKLDEAREFSATRGLKPSLVFTGGEAFLYRENTAAGARNLADIVALAKAKVPGAAVYVKTSGFSANPYLDGLFDRLAAKYNQDELKVRLGINAYQRSGRDLVERFSHMLEKLLPRQDVVTVDTIYDKANLERTCADIEEVLVRHGFLSAAKGQLFAAVKKDPNKHLRLKFTAGGKELFLDLGPAYTPTGTCGGDCYDERVTGPCATIENGSNALYYNARFDLIHCNDSFVDGSVKPLSGAALPTMAAQHDFLQKRYAQLKEELKARAPFGSRKDRCFYCTKFMMAPRVAEPV